MLITPLRSLVHPVRESLESFGVAPGQTVLELGPGPGYFTIEAARIVGPDGQVLCLDLQPGMLGLLRGRLAEAGVTNAQLVVADAQRLPLADGSVSGAFLVTVLGEVPDRVAALRELRRVLRPGGVLAFMETLTDPDYMLEDTTRDLCRALGFQPRSHDRRLLGYIMTFTAP
jgi:ubiquinone/menaquinone biosynthesis C-methylase UbiE